LTYKTTGYRAWLMTVSEGEPHEVIGLGPVERRVFELEDGQGLPDGWYRHPGKVFEVAEAEAVRHPETHVVPPPGEQPPPKRGRGRPRKPVIDATTATIIPDDGETDQ
jgi:hypothetical protein